MSEHKSNTPWQAIPTGEPIAQPWRPAAILIGGFLYAVIALWLLGHFVHALIDAAPDGHKFEGIRNVGLILVAVVGGPFVLYRSWVLGRQAKTAEAQAALAEDRNFSDLFTKAVEQLGADKTVKRQARNRNGALAYDENGIPIMQETTEANVEVRLGAIYALQRISRASEKDHIPVMETLCAYIRENAIGGEPDVFPDGELPKRQSDESLEDRLALIQTRSQNLRDFFGPVKTLRSDIRAALTVIGQRDAARRAYEKAQDFRLNFRRANLQRADLVKVDFEGADLSEASLQGANLHRANMEGANLSFAQINGAYLNDTIMEEADCSFAKMQGASLSEAKIARANLFGVAMEGAELINTHMERADLSFATMGGANLFKVRLEGADLNHANLESADLYECFIDSANVSLADFTAVTDLTQNQLNQCFGCAGTKLPDGLSAPNHWHDTALDNIVEQYAIYQNWLKTHDI